MSVIKKIGNLNRVVKKLRKRKFGRMKEIIRDYGMREFVRRVQDKMQHGDNIAHLRGRNYVITNEAYLPKSASLRGFVVREDVQFCVTPGSVNVGRVDVLTADPQHRAIFTLRISDAQGNLLAKCSVNGVHEGYTEFDFEPILDVMGMPLTMEISSDVHGAGALHNPRGRKHGFDVQGGGRIACKVYTQLDALYVHWMKHNTPTPEELAAQRAQQFATTPKISIVTPLYNTPERYLRDMIDSVRAQSYENWELCLADGSAQDTLGGVAASYGDARLVYRKLQENTGIAGNSNEAIRMATGDYIALLDHDDLLAPQALYENVVRINEGCDFVYSDEDKVSEDGTRRFDPFFKPDFSPHMLQTFNYITHFVTIKKSLLDEVGYFDAQFNGAQDYDLFLRVSERAQKIGHIADILYHWRISDASTAGSAEAKEYTVTAGKAALEAAFVRRKQRATVENAELANYYRVRFPLPEPLPKISIVIPNKDNVKVLSACLKSLEKSSYPDVEILVAENNSTLPQTFEYYKSLEKHPKVRVLRWEQEFNFAKINNFAARQAQGEYLVFLNNDITAINADWLEQMLMYAALPEVGAVGAKLYYPDDTVQHGGVVLRIGGIAGHSHKFADRSEVGSLGRLIFAYDVSAVTGACLMVRKALFEQAGAFDEAFAVAYNDVDLCLKIRELGKYNVWTPFAELYHHESVSRGYEETPEKIARFDRERVLWLQKWEEKYPVDPFYSKNLTHIYENYSINPYPTMRDGAILLTMVHPNSAGEGLTNSLKRPQGTGNERRT